MNNFIEEYKNVLPGNICDFLIEKFEENINLALPGAVGGGRNNQGVVNSNIKSTLDLGFLKCNILNESEFNSVLLSITNVLQEKIKEYFLKHGMYKGIGSQYDNPDSKDFMQQTIWNDHVINHSGIYIKRYLPEKDFYHWHIDAAPDTPAWFCRQLVLMFYLNDVKEGGETEFFNQKLSIKPTKGTLVIFPADFTGKHRGLTPKSGKKYIMNSWLLQLIEPLAPAIIESPKEYFYLNKGLIEIINKQK